MGCNEWDTAVTGLDWSQFTRTRGTVSSRARAGCRYCVAAASPCDEPPGVRQVPSGVCADGCI